MSARSTITLQQMIRSIGFFTGLLTPILLTKFVIKPTIDSRLSYKNVEDERVLSGLRSEIQTLNWHLRYLDEHKSLLMGQ